MEEADRVWVVSVSPESEGLCVGARLTSLLTLGFLAPVVVKLETEDLRRALRYAGFKVGLARVATDDRPFHVADAGSRGGGIFPYLAAFSLSDDRTGFEALCLSVRFSLLRRVELLFSRSGGLDIRLPASVFEEKADDCV
jgi:hypothetical protein